MNNFAKTPRYLAYVAPIEYKRERLTLRECKDAVRAARAVLEGWAMPWEIDDVAAGSGYVFANSNFRGISHHIEEWRLYRSGQFVHHSIPFERLNPEFEERARGYAEWNPHGGEPRAVDVSGFVSFVALINFVTLVFHFAASLVRVIDIAEAEVYVGLRDVCKFALGANELAQRLNSLYVVRMNAPSHRMRLTTEHLTTAPAGYAADALEELFQLFNWERSRATIESYQGALLGRT